MRMSTFKFITYFLVAMALSSCSNQEKNIPTEEEELLSFDVSTLDNKEYEIKLSDLMESVEIIQLDNSTEEAFGRTWDVEISDNYIATGNVAENVKLYHRKSGKYIGDVGKRGQGPGEYPFVYYAAFDWEKEEVYVHIPFQNQMFVYSLDGEFKRQFALNDNFRQHDMVNGTEHLVMYKVKPGKNEKGRIEPPYRPITYMSKADGAVDSLSFQQNYHTSMCIKMETMDGNVITSLVSVTALKQLNGSVYLNEIATDTIYRLDGKTLEPMMSRTPSVETESGAKIFL